MSTRSLLACPILLAVLSASAAPVAAQAPPRIRLVKDTNPGAENGFFSRFAVLGPKTLFAAFDPLHGDELWVTDGTTEGTAMVKDIDPAGDGVPGDAPFGPVAVGGFALFAAEVPAFGRELWRTDGTEAGTTLVKDLAPGAFGGIRSTGYAVSNGGLYFCARTAPATAPQMWRSDGSPAGTYVLSNHDDWEDSFRGCNVVAYGDRVLYTTDRNRFLWSTDGTVAGTILVKDLGGATPPEFYDIPALVSVGRFVFFAAAGPGGLGWEVWRTDGTAAGTVLLKDVAPGSASSRPLDLRATKRNHLTFTADDGVHGNERWISDGTTEGTRLLADIAPGSEASVFAEGRGMAALASGRMVFTAFIEGVTGVELWASDGTTAGTGLLKDIKPGAPSGLADWPPSIVAGGDVYFGADDGVYGAELWRSDGTPAGTHMVEDTLDGGIASYATPIVLNGSTMLVGAWHWETGYELYAYDLPALSVAGWKGPEHAGAAAFVVTVDGPADFPIQVAYETVNGSATADADYAPLAGTLTFTGPATSQTILVPLADDGVPEANEQFTLALRTPKHAVLRTAEAVAVIVDDDGGGGSPRR